MNVYECVFMKADGSETVLRQYGGSEEEITRFWTEWWPEHYSGMDPSAGKFAGCRLVGK